MHGKKKKKRRIFATSEKEAKRWYKRALNNMAKRIGSKKRRQK